MRSMDAQTSCSAPDLGRSEESEKREVDESRSCMAFGEVIPKLSVLV